MPPGDLGRAWILLAAAYAAAAVIFSLWPGIDLWVSGLFYRPGAGFFLARSGALELLRETVWGASVLVALAAAGLLVLSALGRPLPIGTRAEASNQCILYQRPRSPSMSPWSPENTTMVSSRRPQSVSVFISLPMLASM